MTSEELRIAALAASAKRGKAVSQRRIAYRWMSWTVWRIALPVIGLLTVLCALSGIAYWQYFGHDVAYSNAQKWVQKEFGNFTPIVLATKTPENDSTIPVTEPAMPVLQIERNLTFKANSQSVGPVSSQP